MKITFSKREIEHDKDDYTFTGNCYIGFDYKETRYLISDEDIFRKSVDFMKERKEIVPIFDDKERIIDLIELKGDVVEINTNTHHKIRPHEKVIEIKTEKGLIATIVPRKDSISILSKYYRDVIKDDNGMPTKIVVTLKE